RLEDFTKSGHADSKRGFYGALDRTYGRILQWAMGHRWLVVAFALLVMASSVPLYRMVHQEYLPTNVDESGFEMSVSAPEGVTLAAMDGILGQVEKELFALPGIEHVLS